MQRRRKTGRRTDTGRTNTGRADTRRTDTGRAESGRAESGRTADTCYTGSYIGEIIKSINCENGRCSKYNRNYPDTDSFLHRDCAVWYNERMAKS